MDGSRSNIEQIINAEYFWRYELSAKAAFIDKENINELLQSAHVRDDVGIFHIDLDGNDYWIWREVNKIKPIMMILEYNSIFGVERAITVPYDKSSNRTKAHYSNLYFGASLRALHRLSDEKGYAFIGCNSAGNNAYFVRRDALNDIVRETPLEHGYVLSKFRESRDQSGTVISAALRDSRLLRECRSLIPKRAKSKSFEHTEMGNTHDHASGSNFIERDSMELVS